MLIDSVINRVESLLKRRSFQVHLNGSLSQVAETASGFPLGSVFVFIPFVIYINDLAYYRTIGHLLYVNDVKLIAPEIKRLPPQGSLGAKSKW